LWLLVLLVFAAGSVSAQNVPYRVPRSLEFAGLTVKFEESARSLVQTDVNALMSNRRVLDSRLERLVQYFPMVESILAEEEVPTDFKYLVVQESGLVPDAVSTSNAVGFWQFKKETAGDFGLRVDGEVDERKNIHASTRAAAQYLKRNNQVLNNWISTLYSYYLGLGGIRQLVPAEWTGASQLMLNGQTDRYILRCMAHKIVYEQELETYKPGPVSFYEYRYANGKTFAQVAAELQVDEAELRRHNRWVGGSSVPMDKEYLMLVPTVNKEQMAALGAKAKQPVLARRPEGVATAKADLGFPVLKRTTPANVKGKNSPIFYEINGKPGILAQAGDSPQKIADRADVSLRKFLKYNDLNEGDRIVANEVYYLKKKARKAAVPFHTAQPEQTLWQVSQLYGIRMKFLLRNNRIETVQRLQPGRVLWLQKRRPASQPVEVIQLPDNAQPLPPAVQPGPAPRLSRMPEDSPTGTPPPSPAMVQRAQEATASASNRPTSSADREVEVVIPKTSSAPRNGGRVVLVPENESAPTASTANRYPTTPNRAAQRPTPAAKPKKGVDTEVEFELESKPQTTAKTTAVPSQRKADVGTATHTIEQGETFFSIARKYNLSVSELRDLNGLTENPAVRIGDELVVRAGTTTRQPVVEASAKPRAGRAETWAEHTVEQGETFFSLTRKYNVTPQDLRDWNGFADYPTLKIGQVIKVKK
jgi:membrane-bound lytic murein transglycosylase D